MDQSSSDSETEIIATIATAASAVTSLYGLDSTMRKYRGGSSQGRSPNRNFNVQAKNVQLDKDLFCRYSGGLPLFSETEFERSFRMPRVLYEEIRADLLAHNSFWQYKCDATGKYGASTDLKLFTAFQMICDDRTAFSLCNQVRQSEPQNMKCMKTLCEDIVYLYEGEWLRRPNKEELVSIEKHYRELGFPGCVGAVDCAGWVWENCPVGWQGLFTGKEGKPSCRMEVISDDKLRIWHLNFGIPGSKNDKTIIQHSGFFNDIRNKNWPPVLPEFDLEGFVVRRFYYLADGIYPKFMFLALPHPDPRSRKEKKYAAYHSSARKAVERVFGVVFRQFRILYNSCRLGSLEDMECVVKACAILHNMIAEKRGYAGTIKFKKELEDDEDIEINLKEVITSECRREQARQWRESVMNEQPDQHKLFTEALIKHIWNRSGDDESDGV